MSATGDDRCHLATADVLREVPPVPASAVLWHLRTLLSACAAAAVMPHLLSWKLRSQHPCPLWLQQQGPCLALLWQQHLGQRMRGRDRKYAAQECEQGWPLLAPGMELLQVHALGSSVSGFGSAKGTCTDRAQPHLHCQDTVLALNRKY